MADKERRARYTLIDPERVLVESSGRSEATHVSRTSRELELTLANGRRFIFGWASGGAHAARTHVHQNHGLTSPMPGLVLRVLVRAGEKVRTHQTMIVLEAMKMEHAIEAPYDGVVKMVHCAEGGRVAEGVVLIELEADGAK